MSALVPEPGDVKSFKSEAALEAWMRRHHQRAPELWLRIYKKDSGVTTVTIAQALDVALCWGWIDGIRRAYDELSFVQRFTPRRPRSMWSQVNQGHVARLTAAGRMTPFGQAEIDAAKADGRWDAAYAPIRAASWESLPADLRAAIEASPRARTAVTGVNRQHLFALGFRVNAMKTPAGRSRRIAALVRDLENRAE